MSMEFFLTRPIRRTRPMKLNMLSVLPVNNSAPNAPINDSGIARSTVTGWIKLSNCAASIM
ncbi:hypothetical protein MBAV_001129 [Candidatus Magnetobacterium bavaricum]|uniref:Uncharacterized protein n=1 Tax=Candidatus Magnetobacterium bavaricum TaxID=29290 RepID=A0A0F3GXG7_9BACT|nr:hypothetical protein MBAV_001129 [Candidatus Magnetobacterium bavaricum]